MALHPSENLATDFLLHSGYTIIHQNYRYKKAEVDIVASRGDWLIIVEVKSRKSSSHGHPEAFVNEKKVELLQSAAEQLLEDLQWQGHLRFDIISVSGAAQQIEHFEDAF